MKKSILITLLGLSTICFSQKKITYNITGGVTASLPKTSELTKTAQKLEGAPVIKSNINVGFFINPSANCKLQENTSIDFGIEYSLESYSINERVGPSISEGTRNISNLRLPINFNYHFGKKKSFQIGAGPFINFIISAKESGETNIDYSSIQNVSDEITPKKQVTYKKDIKEYFNSFSFGAYLQLKKNVSFSAKSKGFIFLRVNQYINSIKGIEPSQSYAYEPDTEKEPTVISLGLGFRL